jgi:hypothetical protein
MTQNQVEAPEENYAHIWWTIRSIFQLPVRLLIPVPNKDTTIPRGTDEGLNLWQATSPLNLPALSIFVFIVTEG